MIIFIFIINVLKLYPYPLFNERLYSQSYSASEYNLLVWFGNKTIIFQFVCFIPKYLLK